jgi:hypothetical protein
MPAGKQGFLFWRRISGEEFTPKRRIFAIIIFYKHIYLLTFNV